MNGVRLLPGLLLRAVLRASLGAVLALVFAAATARNFEGSPYGYSRTYFVVTVDHSWFPVLGASLGANGLHPHSGPTSRGYYALVAVAGYELRLELNRIGCTSCVCGALPISAPKPWPRHDTVDVP